jgi:outer membrane protein assembly factor BamB
MEILMKARWSIGCLFVLWSASLLTGQTPNEPKAWWPQFLGPQRDGRSREKNLNVDWQKTPPKVLWKVPLGKGYSSFAIVGERLFTMCKRDADDIAICLDAATGRELWATTLAHIDKQRQGAGPRATPTYADGKLYCLMPMGELFCLSAADGKKLWSADQFKDTGAKNPAGPSLYWGVSLSPLVEGDLVIVQPGGSSKNSVAAYHKNTGKLVWMAGDDPPGYASPFVATIAGQRQVIMPTGASILGMDPVKGTIHWRYGFGNQFKATCANPVWQDNLLLVTAAYGAGSAVLEIAQKDGQWSVQEKWKNKKLQALFATPMISGGKIYGFHGDLSAFMFKCVDLQTGAVLWDERLDCRHFLLAIDGHILSWSERGSLGLVEMQAAKYVQKAVLPDLLRYKCWAAPALADGRLYLRDESQVLCLDLRHPG